MTSVRLLVRFSKKLWFPVWCQFYKINCSFGFFLFGFWDLRFWITFVCRHHLSFMPLGYDTRNDVLACWIGPTNCHPNWLSTGSSEIRHEEKYFVDPMMLEDELWIKKRDKLSPNCRVCYWKQNCGNWVLEFWGQFISARFLETDIRHFHWLPHTPN